MILNDQGLSDEEEGRREKEDNTCIYHTHLLVLWREDTVAREFQADHTHRNTGNRSQEVSKWGMVRRKKGG